MSSPRPKVSVVVPTFNRRKWLPVALASLDAQTFRDFELVIVDDASTDGTSPWLRRARPDARLLRLRRNSGPGVARNAGIEAARAPLVAFLDSDDVWRPMFLERLVREFQDRRVAVAFSNLDRVDERGFVRKKSAMRRGPSGLPTLPLLSATMVRRSALRAVGGFDPAFRAYFEDVDLFTRLALRYGRSAFRLVDEALAAYRLHDGQSVMALGPTMRAWADPRVLATREGPQRLDLVTLGLKHAALLALIKKDRRRFPPQELKTPGFGLFEFALHRTP